MHLLVSLALSLVPIVIPATSADRRCSHLDSVDVGEPYHVDGRPGVVSQEGTRDEKTSQESNGSLDTGGGKLHQGGVKARVHPFDPPVGDGRRKREANVETAAELTTECVETERSSGKGGQVKLDSDVFVERVDRHQGVAHPGITIGARRKREENAETSTQPGNEGDKATQAPSEKPENGEKEAQKEEGETGGPSSGSPSTTSDGGEARRLGEGEGSSTVATSEAVEVTREAKAEGNETSEGGAKDKVDDKGEDKAEDKGQDKEGGNHLVPPLVSLGLPMVDIAKRALGELNPVHGSVLSSRIADLLKLHSVKMEGDKDSSPREVVQERRRRQVQLDGQKELTAGAADPAPETRKDALGKKENRQGDIDCGGLDLVKREVDRETERLSSGRSAKKGGRARGQKISISKGKVLLQSGRRRAGIYSSESLEHREPRLPPVRPLTSKPYNTWRALSTEEFRRRDPRTREKGQ
ncbi:uncharacterized protein LOC105700317 isoform X2 [Orussus abietinus]|uniref:uncharacterized protein LOC105700317 isoform X2 n=1 Tax=Orussus abietinus TaxID=222816 RepID=UPI000625C5FC|nr:uncharacterized protein LOC105700317 isoform X2 [Orussus abietinus]